jgi:hypothetical protein
MVLYPFFAAFRRLLSIVGGGVERICCGVGTGQH